MVKNFNMLKATLSTFKINMLVQCGSEDKLIRGSEKLNEWLKMGDKTIKIYEGLYHEVYNELEKDRAIVLKDLKDWLNSHIQKKI